MRYIFRRPRSAMSPFGSRRPLMRSHQCSTKSLLASRIGGDDERTPTRRAGTPPPLQSRVLISPSGNQDLRCHNDRVRTTPLVGKKLWFAPRRFGWGLSPISIEGWLATIAALGVGIMIARKSSDRRLLSRLPAICLVVIALLKGTAPGGPRARAAFIEATGTPASS